MNMDQLELARSRTWAEVDLDAVKHNFRQARNLVGPAVCVAAVLKANGYGHGAVPVARALYEDGLTLALVACLSEALEIRQNLPDLPVLVMGYTRDQVLAQALAARIQLTVFSLTQARILSRLATDLSVPAAIHIKIDTGFHRLGLPADLETVETIKQIARLPNLQIKGIFTHLALTDRSQDQLQMAKYNWLLSQLTQADISIPCRHVCDSIGMVRYPEWRLDMVRIGAFLYGTGPLGWQDSESLLVPTLTVKTRITQIHALPAGEGIGYDATFVTIRPSRIGTLSVGYADGYPRCLSNKAQVALHGRRAPLVGLLCMDQAMVDLTDVPAACPGDEVVLLGGDPENRIPILEYATWADTNRNEAMCLFSPRVPRVYRLGGKDRLGDARPGDDHPDGDLSGQDCSGDDILNGGKTPCWKN